MFLLIWLRGREKYLRGQIFVFSRGDILICGRRYGQFGGAKVAPDETAETNCKWPTKISSFTQHRVCNKYYCTVLYSWPIKVWQSHQLPEKMHVIQLHVAPSSDERHDSGPFGAKNMRFWFSEFTIVLLMIFQNTLAVLVVVTKCQWITLIRVSDTCQILVLLELPKYLGTNISRYFIYFKCLKYHFIWEQIFPQKNRYLQLVL